VFDGFYYAKNSLTKNYFLSHFHSDHYGGITSSWNAGIIYCSLPTATLVNQQLGVDKKYLHPLPMMTPTVLESRGKPVTVTLLDANHCPGAVMFLYEVGKRSILHVGDFRWNRQNMLQFPLKAFSSGQRQLDELFLDTTYCDPKYALPTQEETIQATIATVEKEIKTSKANGLKTLHLFGSYTIGKERIWMSVAEHFGWKVYVDKARFRILSALDWSKEQMAVLTTRQEESHMWVVPLGHINMKRLPEYFLTANNKPFAEPYSRIVGYRPTGWSLGGTPSASIVGSRSSGKITIHSVPYSEHSSFPELVDCLECLRPKKIVPTVSVSKSNLQIDLLLNALKHKQTRLSFDAKSDKRG
jgi:DNA cross-link repair 1A protein